MEKGELRIIWLDLLNVNKDERCKEVQRIKAEFQVRSMDYNKKQRVLAVGYFGEVIELYKLMTIEEMKTQVDPSVLRLIKFFSLSMAHS